MNVLCKRRPEICERFDRFWEGADTDRPVLFISAPREDPDRSVARPELADPTERVLPEKMVQSARYRVANTAYYGEGYPHFFVNFGPGILHGCIGGEADFSSTDTTWFPEFLSDIEEFTSLRFQPEGKWWSRIMACTNALLDEVGEEVVVSVTDIGGAGDILATAVGVEKLMLDMIDRPAAVKAAVDHCHKLWMEAYEINQATIAKKQDVSTPWWPVLSRGRTYMTQCDLNSMISPKVFSDLFVEQLGATFDVLDHGCFHLDGIGTEGHVPALVAQKGLKCIQWVPEPGTSPLEHTKMLQQIQEAGRSITFGATPEEVERCCKEFDPRRLMLSVECESAQQAEQLIENTLRWCEKR